MLHKVHVDKPGDKIKKIRLKTGLKQKDFANTYHIPVDTYRKWELGLRIPPKYVLELLQYKVDNDIRQRTDK